MLFTEVPGCSTVRGYGQRVLSNRRVAEAIEEEFVPVAVYNNAGGDDRRVLKSFEEPTWNDPAVRIVRPDREALAPRLYGDYSKEATPETMVEALRETEGGVPGCLELLYREQAAAGDTEGRRRVRGRDPRVHPRLSRGERDRGGRGGPRPEPALVAEGVARPLVAGSGSWRARRRRDRCSGRGPMDSMRAVVFDGRVKLDPNHPVPGRPSGWASIRVRRAGICGTDLELVKGYMGYRGVLGHEFVGTVEEADDPAWRGRRVVGEINAACGACSWCEDGLRRHCPSRTVLGIMGLDGCMAERCVLPTANLHVVPDDSSDDRAVFLEPLSAAHEILEQVPFHGDERVVVLGDGKLGILCAWTLATAAGSVTLVGHHASKLEAARWGGLQTALGVDDAPRGADVVVEATGTAAGLGDAIGLCRPRGTLVLKSTVATRGELDLAPVVIHEISVVGSRCGPFERGIAAMREQSFPVERLVADRYPLAEAERAFERAATRGVLKVLLEPEASS